MKYLFCTLALIFSSLSLANGYSTSAATPYVPCYVDGVYIGTLEYSHCKKQRGTPYKEGKKMH